MSVPRAKASKATGPEPSQAPTSPFELEEQEYISVTTDHERNFCTPVKPLQQEWKSSAGERARDNFFKALKDGETWKGRHPDNFRIIARYNFKGGVGKTTSTFELGWQMASKPYNRRVLMVDADAQCNLTQLVLGRSVKILTRDEDYDSFFKKRFVEEGGQETKYQEQYNLALALAGMPMLQDVQPCEPAQPTQVGGHSNLLLLPGHPRIQLVEQKIARAINDKDFKNNLGYFYSMLRTTALAYGIDFVLIDLPPSLGALTRVAVTSSHYLMIPFSPDFFSWQAIMLLADVYKRYDTGRGEDDAGDPPDLSETARECAKELRKDQDGSWLQWLSEKVELTEGNKYPLPKHHGVAGPRLLGGHLCRFQPHYPATPDKAKTKEEKKPKRNLIQNADDWYLKIQGALKSLNANLPAELRMPRAYEDGGSVLERYWGKDDHGLSGTPESREAYEETYTRISFERWHLRHGLVLGLAANYNQLALIAQRESLPVSQLAREHLRVPAAGSAERTRPIQNQDDMLKRVKCHNADAANVARRLFTLISHYETQ